MTDPERTDWPAVILAVGAGVAGAFQVGKAPIALPLIRAELGLDLAAAAWVLSTLALLGALAPSLPLLLASRAVEGIGLLVVVIAAPALIAQLTRPEDRNTAFGLWGCFMPTGMALAMLAAPLLPLAGWRGLWWAMAALLAGYGLAVHRRMPHPPGHAAAGGGHLLRDLAHTAVSPGPALLAAIFFTYTAAYMALTGFLPTLLIERLGISPGLAGVMTAAVAGANVIGSLASGPLLRRGVRRWQPMIAASGIIGLAALGIFNAATPPVLAYGLCLAFSAFGGLLPGCVLGGAAFYAPERRLVPVTLGLIMQGSNLGQVLGPVMVGATVGALGWGAAALVLAPLSALGIGLALALRRVGRPA